MNYSWGEIVAAVSIVVLYLKAGVPALKWLKEQVEKFRQKQKEKQKEQIHDTAELRRVENEAGAAEWARMTEMNRLLSVENGRLRTELEKKENKSSLSQATITHFYIAFRKIGRSISRLESKIFRAFEPGEVPPELAANMEEVKTDFEAAEKLLP